MRKVKVITILLVLCIIALGSTFYIYSSKIKNINSNKMNIEKNISTEDKFDNNFYYNSSKNNHNEINKSENLDWNLINRCKVLSALQENTLVDQLVQVATKNYNSANNSTSDTEDALNQLANEDNERYEVVINNIIDTIKPNLSTSILNNFYQEIDNFSELNKETIDELYPANQWYSRLTMDQRETLAAYEKNVGYYLINNYSKNVDTYNPQLKLYFNNLYPEYVDNDKTIDKFKGQLESLASKNNQYIENMDKNNPVDVLEVYDKIDKAWAGELNLVYEYISTNSHGYIDSSTLEKAENSWVEFKNKEIELSGQGLTGINQEIEEIRTEIALTELQSYNLVFNLSSFVGFNF